jgi:hypothetical protein
MAEIFAGRFSEDQPLNPDALLESLKGGLESFVVIGYDYDGQEYFASTFADGAHVLWLLERYKKKLIEGEI